MLNYQRVDPLGDVELTSSKKKSTARLGLAKKNPFEHVDFEGLGVILHKPR